MNKVNYPLKDIYILFKKTHKTKQNKEMLEIKG